MDPAGRRRLLRRGGQQRSRPRFPNVVLTDRPQTHQYQLAPPSARLRKRRKVPLRSPLGHSPHHSSTDFFEKRPSPHQNYWIHSPNKGAGIRNARSNNIFVRLKLIITPVAGLIFETKNRAIFLERFFRERNFGTNITCLQLCSQ